MFKRFYSILLAIILFYYSFGYIIVYYSTQQAIKQEMWQKLKKNLPKDQLKTITVTKNTKIKYYGKKEFEYNGIMHDIISKEQRGDTTIFICIEDKNETKLKNNLKKQVALNINQNPAKQDKHNIKFSFFKLNYYSSIFKNNRLMIISNIFYSNHSFNIKNRKENPPTPPPQKYFT